METGSDLRNDNTSWQGMQFGLMSVSDVTRNPLTGETRSEAERIRDVVTIAKHAEDAGLDVFAACRSRAAPLTAAASTGGRS